MAKLGRPKGSGSKYTISLGEAICAELSEGKPLRQICREHGLAWVTIYNWREAHPNFDLAITRARDVGMDAILEETLSIADTHTLGKITTYKGDGSKEVKEEDMLGHRKLQIETRLKLLAKWNPKKYGEKLEQTHMGDVNAPVALVLIGSDKDG
jgi:transposase-like protein